MGGKWADAAKKSGKRESTEEELSELDRLNDEMGVVPKLNYADDTFDGQFNKQTKHREAKSGRVISQSGKTFTGKTFSLLSMVKQNKKGIEEEVETWNLSGADRDIVIQTMHKALKEKRFHEVKDLFIVDTEQSVDETMNSEDNVEFFENWYDHVHVAPIYRKTEDKDELNVGVDGVESVKQLTKIMLLLETELKRYSDVLLRSDKLAARKLLEKPDKIIEGLDDRIKKANADLKKFDVAGRAIGFDSASSLLMWHNEVIRRKLMNIPVLSTAQGVPTQYWFWRNMRMEALALDFRFFNIPVWLTWKMAKDKDGNYLDDRPKWHDETSGHLSSIWINSYTEGNELLAEFKKCRPRRSLVGMIVPRITANLITALCLGLEKHLEPRIRFSGQSKGKSTSDSTEEEL